MKSHLPVCIVYSKPASSSFLVLLRFLSHCYVSFFFFNSFIFNSTFKLCCQHWSWLYLKANIKDVSTRRCLLFPPLYFKVHVLKLFLNTISDKSFGVKHESKLVSFVQKVLLSCIKIVQLCCIASVCMFCELKSIFSVMISHLLLPPIN